MKKTVRIEIAGDVAIILMDDAPTLNAVTPDTLHQLAEAFDEAARTCRAALLTTSGQHFSSGANLSEEFPRDENGAIDLGPSLQDHVNPLILKLADMPIPWVSAVRGAAAGVGCSLALAADIVLASDTAYFLQAFSRVGLVPDGGAAWFLTRAIGRARAAEMALLGERIAAAKALEWGLVNRVHPDAELDAAARDLTQRLAAGPTTSLGSTRRLLRLACEAPLAQTLEAEAMAQRQAGRTSDFIEGVEAFHHKRAPRFTGA
jgi:2-(1,2-epoxy-1,2-dihydrophenyl)acetyl-CoA isomerase